MNGSYAQHSADTLEHQQGRNSAEINATHPYAPTIYNPYPSSSKKWLDWQIGYDCWSNICPTFNVPSFDIDIFRF